MTTSSSPLTSSSPFALVTCRCDKFGLCVFSSLPVFGLFVLLCRFCSFWLHVRISFQELTALIEFDANSKFLACHLCFDCPHKRRLSGHLRITMPAPCNIYTLCALLDFKVLALVTVPITTLASHSGIRSFPLSTFTISPAFPKALWTWCCKPAQRPYHDRTLGKKRKQRLRPCCVVVSKRYTADTYTSWSELLLFLSHFPPVVPLPTPALPLSPSHTPVGHSGPLGYWLPFHLFSGCRPPFFFSPSSLLVTSSLTFPLSARRPVAMEIQRDLRYVATNVDPKRSM